MKKIIYLLLVTQTYFNIWAQTKDDETKIVEKSYNSWSLEASIGQNKAIRPFAVGYFSSDPTNYFNFSDVNHFDFGVRYMFNPKFGLKIDIASDEVANQFGSGSLSFKIQQYRIGLQGVANLGRLMAFETFTNRFNILGHAGIQIGQITPKLGINHNVTEDNGGIIIGLTPQIKITKWLVLNADFSAISNVRQHFNWDGSYSADVNNLHGMMYNTSIGFMVYLGKKEKHADWYVEEDNLKKIKGHDNEAREKIAKIEKMLEDTDRDGVPDYRDIENNTPSGITVDTKGRFIDTNKNGVPDELERVANDRRDNLNSNIISKDDAIKSLIDKGFVNIFYDVNQDTPNSGSTNNVYYIIKFLQKYPDAKVKLTGYADITGDERKNKDLSTRRAQNLYNIIINSGINSSRVSIIGDGVDKTYPTDSKIGLDLARRVSLILE